MKLPPITGSFLKTNNGKQPLTVLWLTWLSSKQIKQIQITMTEQNYISSIQKRLVTLKLS